MQRDEIGGFVEDGSPVIGTVRSFAADGMPGSHTHRRAQLAWCPDRPVTVETGRALHIVSPNQAIWLPPECNHRIRSAGTRQSINLYVLPGRAPLPDCAAGITVEALESELMRTLASATRADRVEPAFGRLIAVFWDRLARVGNGKAKSPTLPLPPDPRLRRIALAHLEGVEKPLDRWAEELALSRRSLQRLVLRRTGQNWTTWTRALRVARGIAPLMAGANVQVAAHAAGYATASGFIAAFHDVNGITPGQLQRRMRS